MGVDARRYNDATSLHDDQNIGGATVIYSDFATYVKQESGVTAATDKSFVLLLNEGTGTHYDDAPDQMVF